MAQGLYVLLCSVEIDADFVPVRRMLWLRADARMSRWMEEKILVEFEMQCVCRYFIHRAQTWDGWRELASTAGHAAYAARQADMWRQLQEHAASNFTHLLAVCT